MSNATRIAKPVVPSQPQVNALRHRLERGIAALETALACLALPAKERVVLKSIIEAQSRRLSAQSNPPGAPKEAARGGRLSQIDQASRAEAGKRKKQLIAEREKLKKMLEAKRQAEVEAVHRKSGFTNYLRRVPGSFEGGKK